MPVNFIPDEEVQSKVDFIPDSPSVTFIPDDPSAPSPPAVDLSPLLDQPLERPLSTYGEGEMLPQRVREIPPPPGIEDEAQALTQRFQMGQKIIGDNPAKQSQLKEDYLKQMKSLGVIVNNEPSISEIATRPILEGAIPRAPDNPDAPDWVNRLAGAERGAATLIEGLSAPVGLAAVGAPRVAAGIFGAQLAKDLPAVSRAAGTLSVIGTPGESAEATTQMVGSVAMGGALGAGAAGVEFFPSKPKLNDSGLILDAKGDPLRLDGVAKAAEEGGAPKVAEAVLGTAETVKDVRPLEEPPNPIEAKTALSSDYVFHTSRGGNTSIAKNGTLPGSWFAKTPEETIPFSGLEGPYKSDAIIHVVPKSEIVDMPPDESDIFGQEFSKSGIFQRSAMEHKPVFSGTLREVNKFLSEQDAKKEMIPMGAQATGTPAKANIEALTDSLKGIKGERMPIAEQMKLAWDAFTPLKTAKDAVSSAVDFLKDTGSWMVTKFENAPKIDDILRVKKELSAEIETGGVRMRRFAKGVKRAIPNIRVREAISKWVDAGGDDQTLRDSMAIVPKEKQAAYERSLRLTPEEKVVAQNLQNYFESVLQEAIDAGVIDHGIEDYMHRIFEKETPWKKGAIAQVQAGILDTRTPNLAKKRFFELDAQAEAAGYKVVSDFLPRIVDYERSLRKAIVNRAAVKAFMKVKMPDGRPMIDVAGLGREVPTGKTPSDATLIDPHFKPSDEANPLNDRTDYVPLNYPSLKKWKWVAKGEDGKPIFVQGDVLIHKDAVGRMKVLLEPSRVRQSKTGRTLLGVSSSFKNTMLDLSLFHQVQETVHAAEHRVFPWNIVKEIDLENPDVQALLKGGLTVGGDYFGTGMQGEGLFGKSLVRIIPGLRSISQSYHEWLFQDYIPRLKTTMAMHALERNRIAFKKELASGKMTEEQLHATTAEQANAAFGGLNYILMERSKTQQDINRLIFLAPDFLEARARFTAQAGTKTGHEQFVALAIGAGFMYTVARILNKMIDGQYHFEAENAFNVVHDGKSYGLRTVQGDILHAVADPVRFWIHRLNPLYSRMLVGTISGRDEFGRKRDLFERLGDTISSVVPISLRTSREQTLFESIVNSLGVSERRFNEIDRTYKLAQKWKAKNGIQEKGEFIYDPDKDALRPLKIALSENDEEAVHKEIQKILVKDGKPAAPDQMTMPALIKHFRKYAKDTFTSGKQSMDQEFKATLSEDEQAMFDAAVAHKQRILQLFLKAAAQ